jgi:hypothetical protein
MEAEICGTANVLNPAVLILHDEVLRLRGDVPLERLDAGRRVLEWVEGELAGPKAPFEAAAQVHYIDVLPFCRHISAVLLDMNGLVLESVEENLRWALHVLRLASQVSDHDIRVVIGDTRAAEHLVFKGNFPGDPR